jgi:hypothetical protein
MAAADEELVLLTSLGQQRVNPVTDPKTGRNCMYLDSPAAPRTMIKEIGRLLVLGRWLDIGQTGAESWTVLADPQGNEFCVVRTKHALIGYLALRTADPVRGMTVRARDRMLPIAVADTLASREGSVCLRGGW